MSDFLNPLEGDFKKMIDSFFVDKAKEKRGPTVDLNLPTPPELSKEEEHEYTKIGAKEMEDIRVAFLDFQEKISDTAAYPYLYPHIEEFADIAQHLVDLVEHNIDVEDMTEVSQGDYEKLMQVRSRILDQIKQKYKG